MSKEELKSKIADLKVKAFPVAQPVDAAFYTELKEAQDKLNAIEMREREDDFHQRYSAEIAEQQKSDTLFKETTKQDIYRGF
jgi:hypothetical protein